MDGMKPLHFLVIALLVVAVGAITTFGSSSDSNSAATSEPVVASNASDRIVELAEEGEAISRQMGEEAAVGADDPEYGCSLLPEWEVKTARLEGIVDEQEALGADTLNSRLALERIQSNNAKLATFCNQAGF